MHVRTRHGSCCIRSHFESSVSDVVDPVLNEYWCYHLCWFYDHFRKNYVLTVKVSHGQQIEFGINNCCQRRFQEELSRTWIWIILNISSSIWMLLQFYAFFRFWIFYLFEYMHSDFTRNGNYAHVGYSIHFIQ